MKRLLFVGAILLTIAAVSPAGAWNYGDSWILPIAERQGGGWIELPGAGYNGASAWRASGADGVRRIYWKLDHPDMPTTAELWKIEFFVPTAGPGDWQPIESQFRGGAGETFPFEPEIPWAGQFGTNHQWIGSSFSEADRGTWKGTGPGPQAPASADPMAPGNGIYMWLKGGSWLYAKWDFPWDIDRAWSDLRVTVVPEPGTLAALGAGLLSFAGMALRRRS
jgi:hypothetical protein